MISIKKLRASLAVFMIAALVLTPFTSNAAVTRQIPADNAAWTSMNESSQVSPELKVNSEVKNAFAGQRYVEVLISMNEQVDTAQVARETEATVSAKTPYQKKMAQRYAVVDKLQETAEKTQKNVLKLLEEEKNKGNVQEYKSFYIVNMVYVKATEDVINKISKCSEVKGINLNHKIEVEWPKMTNSSVDVNQVQTTEWNIDKVGAPAVWSGFGIDGSGVVVGSIDTGVDYTHEALQTKWRGYNPANPSQPNPVGNWFDAVNGRALPYDEPSIPHGTHVLGTILGQDPDGENIIGVAPGAKFINAKAFTADGGEDSWLIAAGEWMLAPNGDPSLAPDIINNSWGGGSGLDEWYRPMVQAWRAAGILPVFSAGNERGAAAPPASVSNPANYPECFAVGATDRNDVRADFSRRGPSPYPSPDDLKPDISAPGVNVRSSVPGGYESGWSGTSMAAPHITGTAALLLSYNQALTPDQLEQIMTNTATPLTDADYASSPNYGYGYGLVNAFNAVSSVASGIGTIQGKVLKPGVDSEDAVIVHEPITMAFSGMEPTITAQISDNISVTDAELYIKTNASPYWAVIPMERTSGDFKNGVYSVDIPYMFVQEPGFQYKIRAYDYGQNRTETPIYNVTVSFGIVPGIYSTDFSAYPDGWYMDGDWEWGETTTGVAPAGNKLVATNLAGNYSNNSDSWLMTPPIDLRNANTAFLNFRHWYITENSWDKLYIRVSNDYGQTWTQKAMFTGTAQQKWEDYSLDLSSYAHSPNPIFVLFALKSDSSIVKDGWYIDDVALTTTAPAGTGKTVKIGLEKSEVQIGKDGKVLETIIRKLHKDPSEYNYYYDKNEVNAQAGLPLDATVTILETGRTVRTNIADGSYKITHAASEAGKKWTLLVESYGFFPAQEQVQLENNQVLTKNFLMQEMPKGSVSGRVVNERNNEPIAGAVLKIVEDSHVQPVTTDANGYYTIPEVYEGQYTLKAAAQNYKPNQVSVNVVGGTNSEINIQLKPFIGTEDEIGYDDGTAENAYALNSSNNGWAVRMTPNGQCQVKGIRIYIWNNSWPVPGGNEAKFAIYDSLPNGEPGQEVFRTDTVQLVRGQWNDIDISDYGFSTDRDFYVVMIQLNASPNCPGMGIDEDSDAGRSYLVIDGTFIPLADEGVSGNLTIRAKVSYELLSPIITSPVNGAFTNNDRIDVTGTVGSDSLVKVYVNNEVKGEVQTVNKAFTINVPIVEGENIIKATASIAAGETDPSAPIKVTRDITNPVLDVTAPVEGFVTNQRAVDVAGIATDTYLDKVTVNGNPVNVAEDGSFNTEVIVHEGANTITVVAADKAGNSTTITRTVNVGLAMPTITDLMPNADLAVREGDVVTVSFHSDAIHGNAFFRILMPMGNNNNTESTGIRMNEEADGYYVGTWTVPANLNLVNGVVEVEITNAAGNKATAEAAGRITVVMDKVPPVLIPDTEGNAIGQDVTITFENNTEWISKISNILVNGQSAVGSYTVEPGRIIINGSLFGTPGDYQIVVVADGYRDAAVTQTIQNVALLTPPTLRPSSINNYVGKNVILLFTDDPAWRAAITDITVNGQSIAGQYTVYAGQIYIRATAFPTPGTYTIAVKANGYQDAVISQLIRPRAK